MGGLNFYIWGELSDVRKATSTTTIKKHYKIVTYLVITSKPKTHSQYIYFYPTVLKAYQPLDLNYFVSLWHYIIM